MNKAFVREPDQVADYCPRCGTKGESVGSETLQHQLPKEMWGRVSASANFCPTPQCEVVYFDAFERVILTADLSHSVYPKDPTAPVCACFGLTRADIEEDVREGSVTRVKAVLQKARSPKARCRQKAASGRPCVAYIQKYYMQCRAVTKQDRAS